MCFNEVSGPGSSPGPAKSPTEDEMESKDVKELVGREIYWTPKEVLADIVSYEKGWVTIKTDDDVEHKVRAKDIMLMDTEDDLVEGEDGELEVQEGDPSLNSSEPDSERDPNEIHCSCGLTFMAPKHECFQCPDCGRWHRVRLHPNLDNYVKGLDQTPSGRDTVDIDDYVAGILRGMNLDELYPAICIELEKLDTKAQFSKAMAAKYRDFDGTCSAFLEERYAKLNNGMQRMNLGNLLRGALKRQEIIDAMDKAKGEKEAPVEEDDAVIEDSSEVISDPGPDATVEEPTEEASE